MSRVPTASQTVGPFFHIGLNQLSKMNRAHTGLSIVINGAVLDGDAKAVPDAMLEFWHADGQGQYARNSDGFTRIATDEEGGFQLITPRPSGLTEPQSLKQAPHIVVSVFMRGLLRQLLTRIYFSDEPANEADPILGLVPRERRGTLLAKQVADNTFRWNVVLQGVNETVFFES